MNTLGNSTKPDGNTPRLIRGLHGLVPQGFPISPNCVKRVWLSGAATWNSTRRSDCKPDDSGALCLYEVHISVHQSQKYVHYIYQHLPTGGFWTPPLPLKRLFIGTSWMVLVYDLFHG